MNFSDLINLNQFDNLELMNLILRFGFDIVIISAVILLIYRRHNQNKEFVFTLYAFNMIIFVLCTVLNNTELSIGSGFGLFAVFTMMRYRSEQINIKDMTYLLIVVAVGFLNATYKNQLGAMEVAFINLSVIGILSVLEYTVFSKRKSLIIHKVKYEKIHLLKPANELLLKLDLEDRLGFEIHDIQIETINFTENTANLLITGRAFSIDHQSSATDPQPKQQHEEIAEDRKERVLKVGSL